MRRMNDRPAVRTWPASVAALLLLLAMAGSTAAADRPGISTALVASQVVAPSLAPVASGLSRPVLVTNARDGSGRLFVVEQTGKVDFVYLFLF